MYKLTLFLSLFLAHPLNASVESFDPEKAFARLKLEDKESHPQLAGKKRSKREEKSPNKRYKKDHDETDETVLPLSAYQPVERKRKFEVDKTKEEVLENQLNEGLRFYRRKLLYRLMELERYDNVIEHQEETNFIMTQLELMKFILS